MAAEQKRVGAYAKLLANYSSDDAVINAGEDAELLFVRSLAFCATSDSDGWFTLAQVERSIAPGMKRLRQRITALVRENLWVEQDGGYQVRSWLKLHESTEQKKRRLATDRARKRNAKIPDGIQEDSEPSADGNPEDSLLCSYVSSPVITQQDTTGQGSESERPRPKCPRTHPPDQNCGICADDRRELQRWEALRELAERKRRREADTRKTDAVRAELAVASASAAPPPAIFAEVKNKLAKSLRPSPGSRVGERLEAQAEAAATARAGWTPPEPIDPPAVPGPFNQGADK